MSDDQVIDRILSTLCETETLFVAEFTIDELGLDEQAYHAIVDQLEAEDLATPGNPRQFMTITHFGRQVCKDGGWLAHVSRLKKQRQTKEQNDFIEAEKRIHETTLARWKVATFWPALAIGLLGGICGIISLVIQLADRHSQQQTPTHIERTADTTSTLRPPTTDNSATK